MGVFNIPIVPCRHVLSSKALLKPRVADVKSAYLSPIWLGFDLTISLSNFVQILDGKAVE